MQEVEPIGAQQREQVIAATAEYIALAEQHWQRPFETIPVSFDLSGRSAGMFRVAGQRRWIRYNPWIFSKFFEENLANTVPHEVAHYIVDVLYTRHRIRPHGPQWREVMRVFGAEPEVTFSLDLSGVPQRRQQRHHYHCGCQDHALSTTRHHRVLKGLGRYHCRRCRGLLVYQASE
ncbi:SprT-like domain-containing protein [Parahaliea sp. F7430]|uniref:SprT-like domain-containing protein n=1 Tax=Sediminihaliea albiluteola TaxID=2758564 RepID=A0A7W2TVF3_9GAMM|nr:SprT-like domain-containing protein [Sediminihaliea albiluteola]MBA6412604.1 SprT-like domain-containing protein [Sediminihaliea albiluteola]